MLFLFPEICIPGSECRQYMEDNERLSGLRFNSRERRELLALLNDQICEETREEEKVCCEKEVRNILCIYYYLLCIFIKERGSFRPPDDEIEQSQIKVCDETSPCNYREGNCFDDSGCQGSPSRRETRPNGLINY